MPEKNGCVEKGEERRVLEKEIAFS